MKTRIQTAFETLKDRGQKGFIAYITAGDPSLKDTVDIVLRLEEAGVDIVELGIPFSDPLADGRVNQEAATRALEGGATVQGVLECVQKIRKRSEIPLLFFSYMNPLYAYGFKRLARDAQQAGVDGCLLLDLPIEEAESFHDILTRNRLNHINLVTPTSPPDRLKRIVERTTGFVYAVSRTGVTGMQKKLEGGAGDLLALTRRFTHLPIALGFGISKPAQAKAAARMGDAVIVGSAIVDRLNKEPHTAAGRMKAVTWVKTLVDAVKEV